MFLPQKRKGHKVTDYFCRMKKAIIHTEKGDMTVEFYHAEAPGTVANTCFGRVVEGLDIIDQIRQGDKMTKVEIVE